MKAKKMNETIYKINQIIIFIILFIFILCALFIKLEPLYQILLGIVILIFLIKLDTNKILYKLETKGFVKDE